MSDLHIDIHLVSGGALPENQVSVLQRELFSRKEE